MSSPHTIETDRHTFSIFLDKDLIRKRTRQIAASVGNRFNGEQVRLLGVLQGARPFMHALYEELVILPTGPRTIEQDTMRVKSYAGDKSKGTLQWLQLPCFKQEPDIHTIIIEDIVDTGRTLDGVTRYLNSLGAASVSTAVLLDKAAREVPFEPDWAGFAISNAFVIGHGLDLNEKYRDLPHIYAAQSRTDQQTEPSYTLPPFPAPIA